MSINTNAIIYDEIMGRSPRSVLVISYHLPQIFEKYRGNLTFLGSFRPEFVPEAQQYNQRLIISDEELVEAINRLSAVTAEVFDVVYIDHNHRIEFVIRQTNAALEVTDRNTLFLYPGVVPPDRSMAGPIPTQDWWVGETWVLSKVLEPAGPDFRAITTPSAPTGLLIARDFKQLEPDAVLAQSLELHQKFSNNETFFAAFNHEPLTVLIEALALAIEGQLDSRTVRVLIDASEPDVKNLFEPELPVPWHRAPPVFLIDFADVERDLSIITKTDHFLHGTRVDEFSNVILLGRDVILARDESGATARFYCHNRSPDVASSILSTLSESIDWSQNAFARSPDPSFRMFSKDGRAFLNREELADLPVVDVPIFLGTPDEPDNWGMWLFYNVPGVRHYQAVKNDFPKFFTYLGQPWQRSLLRDLGIDDSELVEQSLQKSYDISSLAMMRQTFRDLALSPSDLVAFDEVGDRYSNVPRRYGEKIFISRLSRTKAGAYRGLVNEEELIEAVLKLGFDVAEPELLPFREQVSLFRSAKVVVGLGGAAMFNVAFCRPEARIVTIESGLGFIGSHVNIFASRGCEYGVILGIEDLTDERTTQRRWKIDINRVVLALTEFL